ncbi:PAS domain-containing protein [Thalassovita sp.]|uniref:PAS domain-containing protein n=1 Tax=Thalassovita sp. TaxID=1979401 RepID=UPI0029DE8CBB|nr:PAS domain-containing protein [Thalassovita sp.]
MQFLRGLPVPVALLDTGGGYVAWSARWCDLAGVTPDQVRGRAHADLFRDRPGAGHAALQRTLTEGGDQSQTEPPGEGRRCALRWRFVPVGGAGGGVAVLLQQDPPADAAEMRKRLDMIRQAADAVAHDFNNVLTVLLSGLKLGAVRSDDPTLQTLLTGASEAAEKGADLAGRLLALADMPQAQVETPAAVVGGLARPEDFPFGDGELILVMDADGVRREDVMKRLEVIGYAVLDAADPAEALRLLQMGEPVDAICGDAALSQHANWAALRRQFPRIGVVLAGRGTVPTDGSTEQIADALDQSALAGALRRVLQTGTDR